MKYGHYETLQEFIDTFPMRPPVMLMAENDPQVMDVQFWLDLYRRTGADAVTLAGGGYVAYYPSRIPYHHVSRFLAPGQDLLGDLVRGCRSLGMKYIFVRTDSHACHQDARDAHPEWIAVDAHGKPRRHWAHPEVWVTCALGPYNFQFMTEVTREIVGSYDVDFIFCNRWAGSGVCYCESCRRMFREAVGLEIPKDFADPQAADVVAYRQWRQGRLLELIDLWNAEIRAIRPGGAFIANAGGGALSDLDMLELARRSPFLVADRQSRPLGGSHWMNGKNAKEFRATMGAKPVLAGVNVGLGGLGSVDGSSRPYRWMDSTKDLPELALWHAEAIVHGMVPRYTKHSSVIYNDLWVQQVIELFGWLQRHERDLRNVAPIADVGLVYSQQTGRAYGGREARERVEGPILGWYQALVESRVPFEMVHDRLLDAEHLAGLRTLVLPNIAALSDQQCDQLRAFVRRGGSLVATFETSLYDERGRRRADFGLADLFGASAQGVAEGPVKNSYLNVEADPDGRWHPLVRGLEAHGRIVNSLHRVPTRPNAPPASRPLTLVPGYPDLPMEELYPRQPRTDQPEAYAREIGPSRIVYFPWDIDRIFWEILHTPHLQLLSNAVAWANGREQPAVVDGPGVLDIALWRQKASISLNVVNLTNPMMMRGSYRDITPVGEQTVRLRLPEGARPLRVRLLRSEAQTPFRADGAAVTFAIPRIDVFEIALVDLEQGGAEGRSA